MTKKIQDPEKKGKGTQNLTQEQRSPPKKIPGAKSLLLVESSSVYTTLTGSLTVVEVSCL